jgi:DNA-binding MarR family transcriptional regulator
MSAPEIRPSYLVGRVDRIIRTEFDAVLSGAGLTVSEYTALSVMAARPGLSNARLARRSLVSPQAMHKVVLSLEHLGLVRRAPTAEGGRTLGASLTPKGRATLATLTPQVRAAEDAVLTSLTDAQKQQLVQLLTLAARLGTPQSG